MSIAALTINSITFRKKIIFAYQRFSYQLLLPFLSRLPFFLSEPLTSIRGIINAVFDLEWRSIALGENFVRANTHKAIALIKPNAGNFELRYKTTQRFIRFAREELDAAMFPHKNLASVFQKSSIDGFQKWEKTLDSGQGLVVLTSHFDCFTMGFALLAMKGRKVNLMTSNIVQDPRVSQYVQNFYTLKYQGLASHFNGGKSVHHEDNLRFFYQALKNNEIVFILADLPATAKNNNPEISAPFIDADNHMASGPFRMALKTGSKMAAFHCLNQSLGHYKIQCSDVYNPQKLEHTISHLYQFLQQPIKRSPERWLASDVYSMAIYPKGKLITVIIVNYFSCSDIIKTLESLKKNRCYSQINIHIVDNSCDASESIALKALSQKHKFTLFSSDKNLGFAEACNKVYEISKTPYVFLINPDAYLLDGALDSLFASLEEDHLIAAVGPKTFWSAQQDFILPGSISYSSFSFFLNNYPHSASKQLLWLSSLIFRKKSLRYWQSKKQLKQSNLSGGCVLLKRSAVEAAGGLFDSAFYMYFEDADLFKRLRKQGFKLKYQPQSLAVHQFSGCARDQQSMKNEFMAQSSDIFFAKHYAKSKLVALTRHSLKKSLKNTIPTLWQPERIELGEKHSAEDIVIRLPEHSHYLAEWSPSTFFLPAAGLFFNGKIFHFPAEIWDILPPGHHFLRIAPVEKFWVKPLVWHWLKN